jgi:rsbT co-antagonist protein RsbR
MPEKSKHILVMESLKANREEILDLWVEQQHATRMFRAELISPEIQRRQCLQFLDAFLNAYNGKEIVNIESPAMAKVRDALVEVSRLWTSMGSTPSETAAYIFSLKTAMLTSLISREHADANAVLRDVWPCNAALDKLGLFTVELYLATREEQIAKQNELIFKLSTPLIRVWDRIVMMPLADAMDIDCARQLMKNLLSAIDDNMSQVAIVDVSSVAAINADVARHLIMTVKAARMMGAWVIVTGMRPAVAQTLAKFTGDFGLFKTRRTPQQGLMEAFRMLGQVVSDIRSQTI